MIVSAGNIHITLLSYDWRIRLLWINSSLAIHDPWLAEKLSWEELHIESGLALKFCRNRSFKVHCHKETLALRLKTYRIEQLNIWIDHRIETCLVTAAVRIAEPCDDLVTIDDSFEFLRHRLPLTRSLIETDIAVSGNTLAVHNERDTSLMAFRIEIIKCHGIDSLAVEISTLIDLEVLRPCGVRSDEHSTQSDAYQRDYSFHSLLFTARVHKVEVLCTLDMNLS